jgi:hypothetical protein
MNEQLKEFAYESGLLSKRVFDDSWVDNPKLEAKLKKFTELIVRECATLAYDGPGGILEHFGVEE